MPYNDTGFTFSWKIENFSMLPHQTTENLSSPVFVIDLWEDVEWYLDLYPRGKRNKRYVSCSFGINSELDLKVGCSFTIESIDPTAEICKEVIHHIKKGKYGFPGLISLDELLEKKLIYLPEDVLTIRFHIQILPEDIRAGKITLNNESSLGSNLTRCSSRSCILVRRKSITWPIQTEKTKEEISIRVTNDFKNYPDLKLVLNFGDILNSPCIPIEIQQTSLPLNDKRLFAKCKIAIISGNKEFQDSKEDTHLFESRLDDVWHFPPFIETCQMTLDKYLYVDDILLLHCEFSFSYKDDIYHWEENYVPFTLVTRNDQEETEWCSNIKNIFAIPTFSDIEFKAGGESFSAYKVALCARSHVFTAMFENNMKEKSSGVVEIDDVDPTTLERMLKFMHMDVLEQDLSLDDVCDLYRAADKYAIDSLKRWCSILLISSLSVSSVCDVLALADAHQDNFMMVTVHSFIRSHADEVFYSAFWKSFMDRNLKLSAEVMHQVLTKRL